MDVGGVNLSRLASAPLSEPKKVEPKQAEPEQAAKKPEGLHYPDCDEYVPGDKPAEQAEPAPAAKADDKGRQVERCSTDKVDREIEQLRKKTTAAATKAEPNGRPTTARSFAKTAGRGCARASAKG